ncbi:hypothetical protein SAMN04488127_3042 [Bhargavaea ginsengi]|uniref:Uncharacterized protein n=1 Tax=Bhargavaea ginsengi TaxID=426757 RepID=A0A1H7C7F5_9BACL|nr:hypothetical protein SAMN04488127_3042 [Bhargavaea ginsengi]
MQLFSYIFARSNLLWKVLSGFFFYFGPYYMCQPNEEEKPNG